MKIKNRRAIRKVSSVVILGLFFLTQVSQVGFSLPEGGEVVAGDAQLHHPDPSTLEICASNNTILNFNSYNIWAGEAVIIHLPSTDSIILNRDLSGNPSQIFGNLTSNGVVFLVNTSGITFGPGANVDVAGLIASTRDITNSNFLNANYLFEKLSQEQLDSLLLNQGTIKIKNGGFGVLIAGAIKNEGTIIAPLGKIALAGGDMVKLDISGNGLISVAIDKETASTIFDTDGNPITSQIENDGTIKADGGTVLLKAESLPGIFESAINLEGLIQANDVVEKDGVIKIVSSGDVKIGGATLSAGSMEIGDPELNGKVILTGDEPTYFYGDSTFYNFTSTDFGKEIYFGAGDTYTFKGDTYIKGGRGYDGLTKLFSTQEGSYWYGDFSQAEDFDVTYVAIRDAYNLGDTITLDIGTNWGNSPNWITYHEYDGGGATGNLSDANNYVELTVPTAGDFIRFPLVIPGAITAAIADAAFQGTITSLTFIAGTPASLTLQRNITVTGNYTHAGGTLNLNGQTLQVNGTVSITGGNVYTGNGDNNGTGKIVDSSGATIYPVPATTTTTVSTTEAEEGTRTTNQDVVNISEFIEILTPVNGKSEMITVSFLDKGEAEAAEGKEAEKPEEKKAEEEKKEEAKKEEAKAEEKLAVKAEEKEGVGFDLGRIEAADKEGPYSKEMYPTGRRYATTVIMIEGHKGQIFFALYGRGGADMVTATFLDAGQRETRTGTIGKDR